MKVLVLNQVEPLSVTSTVATQLRHMAIEGYPFEVCGVVYIHSVVVQYPNIYGGDKCHGFDMEVDLEVEGIKALWHSHPMGPEKPSDDDLPCISLLAEHGFTFNHIIVTPKHVSEYEVNLVDDTFTAA